ncbi:carbon-nitrogen hydrolase family protein [Amphritea sp. HPY]|uniref:carbon-nitrogen hydrolase family protein n=1 Tax=Amphritea sp. HPY TaxID=3421652 RepID=UPI003D7DCC54
MRILACQIQIPAIDNRGKQLAHIDALINKLEQQVQDTQVDLVVLPELSTMEYSAENFQNIHEFSEELYGETYERFAAFCRQHNVAVCYGMPRREGDDAYISQVALGRDGKYLTHYDKIHTAEYGDAAELKYFKRGNHLSVFEVDGIKAGIIICYDMRFPELIRRLCGEFSADLILHPVAFARDLSFHTWKQFVVSRALENQVYFMSVNQSGEHFGQSIICPPWVDNTVQPHIFGQDEEFRVVDIDREVLDRVRQEIPYRRDTLDDYDVLPVRHSKKK